MCMQVKSIFLISVFYRRVRNRHWSSLILGISTKFVASYSDILSQAESCCFWIRGLVEHLGHFLVCRRREIFAAVWELHTQNVSTFIEMHSLETYYSVLCFTAFSVLLFFSTHCSTKQSSWWGVMKKFMEWVSFALCEVWPPSLEPGSVKNNLYCVQIQIIIFKVVFFWSCTLLMPPVLPLLEAFFKQFVTPQVLCHILFGHVNALESLSF